MIKDEKRNKIPPRIYIEFFLKRRFLEPMETHINATCQQVGQLSLRIARFRCINDVSLPTFWLDVKRSISHHVQFEATHATSYLHEERKKKKSKNEFGKYSFGVSLFIFQISPGWRMCIRQPNIDLETDPSPMHFRLCQFRITFFRKASFLI